MKGLLAYWSVELCEGLTCLACSDSLISLWRFAWFAWSGAHVNRLLCLVRQRFSRLIADAFGNDVSQLAWFAWFAHLLVCFMWLGSFAWFACWLACFVWLICFALLAWFVWLVGWLGWSVGWLISCLIGWPAGWLASLPPLLAQIPFHCNSEVEHNDFEISSARKF